MVAVVTMFFLFAMVSFVTNLAAPVGTIWKNSYEWSGMLGKLMNCAAYLFMGIPAGNMLSRIGYKKTALWALGVGFVGLTLQYLCSLVGGGTGMAALVVYLLGAFICGFSVCILNTVVPCSTSSAEAATAATSSCRWAVRSTRSPAHSPRLS